MEVKVLEFDPRSSLPAELGLRGLFHRVAPSFFPLKTTSEIEFVRLVGRRMGEGKECSINITPLILPRDGAETVAVRQIGNFHSILSSQARIGGEENV